MKNFDKDNLIEFLILALKRSLWTFAEVIVVMVPIGMSVGDIDWSNVLGVAIAASIVAFCKSIVAGMPEYGTDGTVMMNDTTCEVKFKIGEDVIKDKKSVRLKVVQDTTQTN